MRPPLAFLRGAAADRGALREGVDPDLLVRILVAQFWGMSLLAKTGPVGRVEDSSGRGTR
ncbi:hypothetical protein [Actinomadura mexicana]|uniref:hypothetical protein n=1 Tax=Actinomadura mexicana TaxID=134959 RepID=UPI000B7944A1|nr:hypothetical protein [Actinomadura mexicana]